MDRCIICKTGKHPLYACLNFKAQSHNKILSVLKANNLCVNCLTHGHYAKECESPHRCKKCQKLHHSLLHLEFSGDSQHARGLSSQTSQSENSATPVSSHTAMMRIRANLLLMTCHVQVEAPDSSLVKAHALLDSASAASFISVRLAQSLSLPRSSQKAHL